MSQSNVIDLPTSWLLTPALPCNCSCRIKYEQTIGDLRKVVAKKAAIEVAQLQLFWHGKELVAGAYDDKTLLEMDLHTGFSLMGYDLTEKPDYWPPVRKAADGSLEVVPAAEA